MRNSNKQLLSPEKFHLLSYRSNQAADSGFRAIYATSEGDAPAVNKLDPGSSFVLIHKNGLVDFDGNDLPYSRKKFVDSPHYACIGCSYTVSAGLPVQYSWPSIVELVTGKTVNNYSELGAGYRKIVSLFMDASTRYGTPMHILAMMPDPYRFWAPYPWLMENMQDEIIFGHSYWRDSVNAYIYNTMGSGDKVFNFIDHTGRKHLSSPEIAAFSNFAILYSLKQIAHSMDIKFDCMSWYNSENPNELDMHDVFNIKRNPSLRVETSTSYVSEYSQMEKTIGGEGRWRRHGMPSPDGTCDHRPLTDNQEKFWYVAANGTHPGLHDQIHYAEEMLSMQIPCSMLEEMP
jgi:hypothetical protein